MKYVSACSLDCPDGCSVLVEPRPDGSVAISGNPAHPFTRGFICPKGRRAYERITSKDRVTTPLLRKNGTFHPVDWDTALDLVADRITPLLANPASILHIRSYGYRGTLAEASRFLFRSLHTAGTRGGLCNAAGTAATLADFGDLDQNDLTDLANAAYIVNWGRDLASSSIHTERLVQQARKLGRTVVAISPCGSKDSLQADTVIRIRPGTDRFLAAAVIRKLLLRGYTLPSAMRHAANWEEFQELIAQQDERALLRDCDCSVHDVNLLAGIYANPAQEPVASLVGWGMQRHAFGGENVRFVNALAYLSGQVGRSGGGVYFGNSWSRHLNDGWASTAGTYSSRLLLPTIGQEILNATPKIALLWADGSNFLNQAPDAATTIRAMESVDFSVVVDAFMTDTARHANLILPCALDHEREDILGASQHCGVQYAAEVFPPMGEARHDFDIISAVATRLGVSMPDRETILRETLHTPSLSTTLEELRHTGFAVAEHPAVAWSDGHFAHPDGRYRLPEALHTDPPAPQGYPLHLLTLAHRKYLQSQIPESEHPTMPTVLVHPGHPLLGTLDTQKPIYLATPLGRMPVSVDVSLNQHPRCATLQRGGWIRLVSSANPLIAPHLTDMGEAAAYYSQYARLEN